jgi:hypothetical protein
VRQTLLHQTADEEMAFQHKFQMNQQEEDAEED